MSKSVLIVDDDAVVRGLYEGILTAGGYAVRTARNGAEGVHLARRYRPDLVLLDLDMPVMDGWQALRYLRAFTETRQICIFVVSSTVPKDAERAWFAEMRVDRVLTKPVAPGDLLEAVRRCLDPAD